MAEEDTRRLLRVFGVTVTNFEDQSAQLLERARQLSQAADIDALGVLVKEVAAALLNLQGKWREMSDHLAHRQRQLLTEFAAIIDQWPRK